MPDYAWAERDDWMTAWEPLVKAVGEDFNPEPVWAADPIDASLVRQFNEPLEFDCPLFYDGEVARQNGYPGAIAPYSGLATWTSAGIWDYGEKPVYLRADRNSAPRYRFEKPGHWPPGPDTNSALATDVEYEYHQPFVIGDRLRIQGRVLVSASPKQTGVGRGAFTTWESRVYNQADVHIATQRLGIYFYVAGDFARVPAEGGMSGGR